MKARILLFAVVVVFLFQACGKKETSPEKTASVVIDVKHQVEGNDLQADAMIYTNEAGNRYLITNIQWFLSDVQLISSDGNSISFTDNLGHQVFYVDTDLPASETIISAPTIPTGSYQAIRFTFGMDEPSNQSHRFVNPPESFMFWPEYLGGGYHYMKLNGKWIDKQGRMAPFNFHLGIGQEYFEEGKSTTDLYDFGKSIGYEHCEGYQPPHKLNPVVAFIQNYFEVTLPISLIVRPDDSNEIELVMQVENWFKGEATYDHDQWGGSIMQNQQAMEIGIRNGVNVFKAKAVSE